MEEPVDVFEQLLEESSVVQKLRESARRKGYAEGQLIGLRKVLIDIVAVRYPALIDLALEHAMRQNDIDEFLTTIQSLATASDEAHVRSILSASPTA